MGSYKSCQTCRGMNQSSFHLLLSICLLHTHTYIYTNTVWTLIDWAAAAVPTYPSWDDGYRNGISLVPLAQPCATIPHHIHTCVYMSLYVCVAYRPGQHSLIYNFTSSNLLLISPIVVAVFFLTWHLSLCTFACHSVCVSVCPSLSLSLPFLSSCLSACPPFSLTCLLCL